jgi:hypothetical protein
MLIKHLLSSPDQSCFFLADDRRFSADSADNELFNHWFMKTNPKAWMMLLALTIVLAGCKKDLEFDKVKEMEWTPLLALPLVHDSLTLRDALVQTGTEDHFYIDEQGDISILYYFNADAFRIHPNDLIRLSPVSFPYQHIITQSEQNVLASSDLFISSSSFPLTLSSNSQEIRVDKIKIKKGNIRVRTNNTFTNEGSLTLSILNATINNDPYKLILNPFYSGATESNHDISGLWIDLSESPNLIHAEIEGLVKKSGSPVAGDQISVEIEITIPEIGRFEGFLGKQSIGQMMDTVRVDVFNNAYAQGTVYFVDPQASITLYNSIGIPTEVTIEKLVAVNNQSGVKTDIASLLGAGSVIDLPSPLITDTKPAKKSMVYTNENTGNIMSDFYNIKPDDVAFQVKTVINPEGTPLNFFSDTSTFFADLRVKLPLYGHFDHLVFQDTFDLTVEKPQELDYMLFRTMVTNGLPLTSRMQVYFTDEDYHRIDSLTGTDRILIKEAPVDPSTHLPYPGIYGEKDTTFLISSERLVKMKDVKKTIVQWVMNSTGEGVPNVKFRADQMLKITFTAKAKVRTKIQP